MLVTDTYARIPGNGMDERPLSTPRVFEIDILKNKSTEHLGWYLPPQLKNFLENAIDGVTEEQERRLWRPEQV